MLAKVHDGIAFSKIISSTKAINAWKTYFGFKKAIRTKNAIHPSLPMSLSIEPTTSCNLRCPECPSGLRSFSRPTGMIQQETFKKIIDELHGYLMYLILYFQGEPYLHPSFLALVEYAYSKNIYTATSTNAHFLSKENALKTIESGLNRIIVSMDGTNQETYEKYRVGGNLEKVIRGIENLVAARKETGKRNPYIILQFILFRHNINQIQEARSLARRLGVDELEFKTAQVYDFEKGSELIPEANQYSRYQPDGSHGFSIKNDLLNKCWKMWHSCVMTWDGTIVPCCFDKDAKYAMGNINESAFQEIWNGKPYLDFRSKLFENRKEIDICRNCTEGLNV